MRLSVVKVGTLITFCVLLACIFFVTFEDWYFPLVGIILFLFFYAVVLRFIKRRDGLKFRQFLKDWGENVDPQEALFIRPFIRGILIFDGRRIFTRIGANDRGIYLYKQGCYAIELLWDKIILENVGNETEKIVRVISRSNSQVQFFLSWSDDFNKWSYKFED